MSATLPENTIHLLIPFASVSSPDAAELLYGLKLPNLQQLLAQLTLVHSDTGADDSFSPPHERALARLQGLPVVDGGIPWAAQRALALGLQGAMALPWGFVTLCHGVLGTGSMTLTNPDELLVSEAESRQLLADMQPYFADDGFTLHYMADLPSTWLVSAEALSNVHVQAASLDRVLSTGAGYDMAHWQVRGVQGKSQNASTLRRLQNEMQMLLYAHPLNDARKRYSLDAINSIWLHGTGALVSSYQKPSTHVTMPRSLADAAFREDWEVWASAWQQLDSGVCADLLKRVHGGQAVTLTLCGERGALTYEMRSKSAMTKLKDGFRSVFSPKQAYILPVSL